MVTKAKPKRGGRPQTRELAPGERVHLGLRVSPKLKRQLERAADASTRSLSQEVEFRLEESFRLISAEKLLDKSHRHLDEAWYIAEEAGSIIDDIEKDLRAGVSVDKIFSHNALSSPRSARLRMDTLLRRRTNETR
jgi:hypothetical protein